jgi:hypothetical protein
MAIYKRVAWNVIENGIVRDTVFFPASFDEKSIKRSLILNYGYKGNFTVVKK